MSSILSHNDEKNESFAQITKISNLNSMRTMKYCKDLIGCEFHGQTNVTSNEDSDKTTVKYILHLGLYLQLLDKVLRKYEPKEFTIDDEEYQELLRHVAQKRKKTNETTKACFKRLVQDSRRFLKIYHNRGVYSEVCEHEEYWGSRQQLLSAKVISDHVDEEYGPMDVIFGVLLNPTGGRVGPGDSDLMHSILFDDTGVMAYHSAAHDAFGYLAKQHDVGPGYDYIMQENDSKDMLAGQITGMQFWKEVFEERSKAKIVSTVFKV